MRQSSIVDGGDEGGAEHAEAKSIVAVSRDEHKPEKSVLTWERVEGTRRRETTERI